MTITAALRAEAVRVRDEQARRRLGLRAQHGNVDPDGQIVDEVDEALHARLLAAIGEHLAEGIPAESQLELILVAMRAPRRFAARQRAARARLLGMPC